MVLTRAVCFLKAGWMIAIGAVAAAGALAQTSITIESPQPGAAFPEFSSPVLKVRVADGDGTLRWYAGDPGSDATLASDATDLLAYLYVDANAAVEMPLTNLPPGNYDFGVVTRNMAGDYIRTNLTFTVTNRLRAAPKYSIIPLPNATNTTPVKVNNKGQVVGVSGGTAFLYDGQMHLLGALGGAHSEAVSINNNGQVVGVAEDGEGIRRVFLWEADKGMQRIPVNGSPMDINDHGDVIGNGPQGSFLYRNGTSFVILGPVGDLNENGYVTELGNAIYNTGLSAQWNEFIKLFRPVFGEDSQSGVAAIAINNANEVTGSDYSSVGGGRSLTVYAYRYHAFSRERVGPFGSKTWAQTINEIGDIVGWTTKSEHGERGDFISDGPPHGFFASREGFWLLNDLIANRGDTDVQQASFVNDRREIVGLAQMNGEQGGVLLRPMPQFQSIAFDSAEGKIKASMDGFISTRVKFETSTNLKDWTREGSQDLSDTVFEFETAAQNGSIFLRAIFE